MSNIVDFAEALKATIEAGKTVVDGNVVRVIADNGDDIGGAIVSVVNGGNGTAQTVWSFVAGTAGAMKTTGLAYLALDLGTFGAALAPCFGVIAGQGLYSLNEDFWNSLYSHLYESGRTIGGKVLAFWNGENLYFDEETIEIFKQTMVDLELFEFQLPEYSDSGEITPTGYLNPSQMLGLICSQKMNISFSGDSLNEFASIVAQYPNYIPFGFVRNTPSVDAGEGVGSFSILLMPPRDVIELGHTYGGNISIQFYCAYYEAGSMNREVTRVTSSGNAGITAFIGAYTQGIWDWFSGINSYQPPYLQDGATYPDDEEFPLRYPEWYPLNYPETAPDDLPTVYPAKYPETDPDPYPTQEPAQNPDPESDPDTMPHIFPDLPLPNPNPDALPDPDPYPDPDPQPDPDPIPTPDPLPDPLPDPDPQPDPDPIPDPNPIDPTPDPPNPNPEPEPTPTPPVIPLPDTVTSNKLFTVYNPTSAQLDALGGYLWDSSLMETIKKIWQNPLDGVISLIQIYATPTTGGASNIILGYLDSGVSANVVINQFVTVDCGEVNLKEKRKNATDYSPYTSLYIYLPFIGITELDINDFMGGKVGVKYKIDVYTGACIATVTAKRSKDTPNGARVYEFSGNCSQQIPLTSGNATGMLSALISGAGAGLAIASGGGLGVIAGASMIGRSLTHEMYHVSHSGNLSANAGILGDRKPYLIIGRRQCYDANSYNNFYGFPANTTVILNNCSGFVKVKDCHLRTTATKPEHDEIMGLLEKGVIL